MTLAELIEHCKELEIHEKRFSTEQSAENEYAELVIYNKDLNQWNEVLTALLGPAQKPEGSPPTQEDRDLTVYYGGITTNQTLYCEQFDPATVLAIFWPWKDEVHTTIKLVRY